MAIENPVEQRPSRLEVIGEELTKLRKGSPLLDLAFRMGLLSKGHSRDPKLDVLAEDGHLIKSTDAIITEVIEDSDEFKLYKKLQEALKR